MLHYGKKPGPPASPARRRGRYILAIPTGTFWRRNSGIVGVYADYERRWPLDTKERVWLDVLLYTGLRRGDAVVIGRQHVRGGIATLRTEKSQGQITVSLPIIPVLQRTLDAGPIGELAFLRRQGQAVDQGILGKLFKKACKEAGLLKHSAHGCRKIAATRAAENGATVAHSKRFGWKGGRMAALYTEAATASAWHLTPCTRLRTNRENLCPHFQGKCGRQSEK